MKLFPWDNNIVNQNVKIKVGARECKIIKPTLIDTINFLKKYHYQSSCNGQIIRYGLEYKNKLIAVMTFGYPRYTKKYQYELLRLCYDSNYTVIGGSKKLFNQFLKEYTPNSVISYCDKSKFTGEVYTKLGLKQIAKGRPRKHFWREKDKKHITMAELLKLGPDNLLNLNYGKNINNEEILLKEGFKVILDEGQDNYLYLNITQRFQQQQAKKQITLDTKFNRPEKPTFEQLEQWYLVDNLSIDEIAEKIKRSRSQTRRYLKEANLTKSVELQQACEHRLSLQKFGVDSPFLKEGVREKAKQTCLKRYGVENPFQSKEIMNKSKK